ncbi:hypothetical protein WR25_24447 [Diploscapter pachys]|uniref:G patch domain-containing protein 11 n=1 Tax=Diploscapter pachys TaxID=2018661 RepID=A0A2A2LIW5_9BILA|nr:hypothetical protein WR25_24447 [Diploscapter pachys]
MSSDEEDYMSDAVLAGMETVKPGIAKNREHQRQLRIAGRSRFSPDNEPAPKMTKAELEKERREEALSKPLDESSKGFALLAKMGFKPGMSLGKKKDENDLGSGIKEPLPLEVKDTRTGLGHDREVEEKSKQRLVQEMERMKHRAKHHEKLIDEYRQRKREYSSTKQLIGDILKSRKVCLDLDTRIERPVPAQSWFWKSYKVESKDDASTSGFVNNPYKPDEETEKYVYFNGQEASPELRFDEMQDEDIEDCLRSITDYLRATHKYCVWCGCAFENFEDLGQNCPGPSRSLHDDPE